MLALLAVVIFVTGSVEVRSAGRLSMCIRDASGNRRLFQAGTPICVETDLYFEFPEETVDRRIRIDRQQWMTVDGDCYRLHYAQLCKLPGKQVKICFAADDENGRYVEQEFYFFVR